jgi:N-methylhydantoinase B
MASRSVSTSAVDPFTLEIIRSYFISTVREMGEATKRSAYSTVISEAADFTCGLFDGVGNMIAQADGLPLHAGSLPASVAAIQETFNDIADGDVFLVSDPYVAGLHQADIVVARPIFLDGSLFAMAVNRAHWLDIGGMAAGGWAGTATHVVQEGLRLPPIRLIRKGVVDKPMQALILANVRLPAADWADFQAQVASTLVAERRMLALVSRYGRATIEEGMRSALEYARTRFRSALARLPIGSWSADEIFEDDGQGGGPHHLRVTVTNNGRTLVADFSASDPQVAAPINNTAIGTSSAVYVAAIAALDPGVPLNSGFLEYVEVVTKPGTIAHAVFPAPVFFGPADPVAKTFDVVIRALAQVIPATVIAGSYQTGNNITGSGILADGKPFQWFLFGPGGIGARATKDGLSGEWHAMANCRNESVEIWEHRYPIRFEEFSIRANSGGPGRQRGGLGCRRRLRLLADTHISSIADRQEIGPWGLAGGEDGQPNRYWLIGTDGRSESVKDRFHLSTNSKFANLPLDQGDQLVVDSGGGGGYGPVSERDPALVRRDLDFGYTTNA